MWCGKDFQAMDPVENQSLTMNFVNDLDQGETILSANVLCEVSSGTDASPSSRLTGSPAISGTNVSQRVSGLLPGVVYRLRYVVTTSTGNTTELYTHQPCQSPV